MTEKRKKELRKMLDEMAKASAAFYSMAFHIQCHPFIEMTGFMNEYIKVCRGALAEGIDFTDVSAHCGGSLPMQNHQAAYLGEKFGCIFSTTFHKHPELLKAFMESAELASAKKAGVG